ncbi:MULTISPECIES: hypothetical protein [unclassified Sphingobium]|uniref:CBU_0592 family membrane protein n=1 Tax=unclassified Sphingobium TaxID=2611147 RepID=UPI0035A6C3D2
MRGPMALFVEIVGWAGALLVLGAYLGVSSGRLPGTSAAFQLMNAIGAGFFVLNTWWHGAIPSMALNIIWSAIGFVALWRGWRTPRATTS